MDPDITSDNAQALDDSGTSPEILDSTVSRIWYSVSSFPGLFWNALCWQLNPLIKLYYVIVTSLDGSRGKQRKLICWLEAMCGREVRNLQAVWEDGSIVCDVINAVMVGSCEPKDHHGNCLRHAQELASHHFKLLPVFSNSELQKPFNSSLEKRLWRYLLSLRNALKHRLANNIADQEEKDPEYLIAEEYVARGMGLILASRAERAIFFIYSRDDSSLADIHVHIKGPHGDCGEATAGEPIDSENHTIAIDYRLTPDYLKVCYIPNNLGYHELSLTRYGFNIPGSPFIIKVGEHTGPPSDMFSYLEWLTDEQEERRRLEMEKKRKMKVVSRVIDFITEKMHMTDDGHLVRIDETSLRVPSPVPQNLKRTGRSLSPRPRCKLSSQKRSKSLTNQKLIQAAEFLKCSTPNFFEEKKCVQDAASQVSDDFSMINSVRIDQFQEKCQRIVKACDFLLSHAPKQKSLEILSTAEKILDIPYNNTLTHHKSSFELYRPDNSVTPDINIQNLATESSRSSETDEEKEVIKPCTPEINVTRVDFSDRLYSMRKFDDDGLNAVSSFNSSSSTNENISTPHLNREKDRSKSTSPQKDAKMARKSFQTVGYTKAKRSSQSSFPTSNISDEICPSDNKNEKIEENQNQIIGDNKEMSDIPTVDTIGENEEKQHDSVGDVENLSNVPTLNTIEGIAEGNRDATNEKLVDSSDLSQKNTEEEIDFEHSSTRQSRSREPKLTRNSKQAKKVSNLVKQFENQSVRSNATPLRNELVFVKDGETGDKVENSVKTPIEKKELSGTDIGIIGNDFGVEMNDGKILESRKSLKEEINDLNVFEANDGKSLNVEIMSEKRVKTEKNDGKILEADMNNENILKAEVNDGKSLNIEMNDKKSLETEINEQVMKSSEDDSEIKITGETKENASGADICDLQPSEEPDEISDFVCNSRIEVEQDIKCSTNEDQTITVDETDKTVGVTSKGNEKDDFNTQNKTDDSNHDDKKQSEIIENTNGESALIDNKDVPETISEIAAETAIVEENIGERSVSGSVIKEELQVISSIKSRISAFEDLSRKNVTYSVPDNKEDESIHQSSKKLTSTEDKNVELNDEFLAQVNEEKLEDIKRAGKLLKEENRLEEVIEEDIGLENKEAINNFENLSKSDSSVEEEGMNKLIDNVEKDGVEKHSDEISNFVNNERIDDSNKCSDNQSELQSENTVKQSNITDEVSNEECVLLSVKHLSFDSESNRLDEDEHVVDEVDKRDIDDNTLLDEDSDNRSPTRENVIIDETLIPEKPIENTVLGNLGESQSILGQDTVDDKKEEMPNEDQDGIDKSFVSGLPFPSVKEITLGKDFLGIQNEVERKSDDNLNFITGGVTSNIRSDDEDHVYVSGSEPLVDIKSPSEVLAEIGTTRNIEAEVMKLEIVEQSDDVQKIISSILEPITEQTNVNPSQTDIVSITEGRTEETTDCIAPENTTENIVSVVLEAASVGPSMVVEKNGENNYEGKKEHSIIMNNDTSVPCNNTETLIERNNLESEGSDTKVNEITQNELIESQLENELLENEKNENFVNKMKADVSEVLLSTENVSNVTDGASGAPVTEHQKSEEDVIEENFEGNRNENLKMNILEKLDDNNEILEVEYTDLNKVSTSEEALSKSNEDDNANETLESENDLLVEDNGERDENEVIDDKPSESSVNVINEEENKSEILENSGINIPLALEQDVLFDSNEQKICDDVKIASDEIENSLIEKEQHPFGEDGTSCSKTGADESNDNECFTKGDPSSENEEPAETLQNDKLIIGSVSRIILGVVGMDIGTNIEQVSEISINIAHDSNEKIFKSPEVENIDSIGTNSVDCLRNDTSDNNERAFVVSDENKSTNVEDSFQEQIIIADIGGAKSDLNIIDSEENKTLTDEARADAVQESLSKYTKDQLSMGDSNVTEVLNNNEKILSNGIRLLNESDIANAAEENKGEIDVMAVIQDPETSNSAGEFLKKDVHEQNESYSETGEGVEDLVGDTEGTRHIETDDKIEEKSSNDEESNEVDESTNDNIIEKIHENLKVIKHEKIFDEPGKEFDPEEDRNKENHETAVTEITEKNVTDENCQNKEIDSVVTGIALINVENTSDNIVSNNSDSELNEIIPSIEPLQNMKIDVTTNSCEDSSNIESCQIERDELLVVCDTNENNMLQFDHNSECTAPPNETGMHTLEENVIHNIDKETVITEDNIPQVFEAANQNTNEKNTEIDNLEECPQIIQNDNKGTTELINRVECSLENRTSTECSVEDESHIIEHEIKIDKNLVNNGGESEKRKNENFTEETEDEAFIHGNQRSPAVDNNNIVSSKEESDELIIKADADSEVTEDSDVTIGREPDDSAKESEIMEAVENSITETVERRVIIELNEGITENTVSVIETYENGKEANKVEDFKIQNNLNEIGENVRDPSDKIVIEQELQENTSSITEEDLEEKIKSEDVIIEQMNLEIEKTEQCIDSQQNDIEMVVENTNDISYSIDTIEESSIVKEDDEIPKNELRIIESSKDEHVHESQHENPIIDIPTEDRSHENSKGGLEQSDEVCVPLNETTVEQNKSLENSVKEGISTNEEMPEYDKSVQEIIVGNEYENTEMEIEGNRENNVLDFDIDSNSQSNDEIGNEKLLVECNEDASKKLESVSDLVEIIDEKSDAENSSNDEIPITDSNYPNPELRSQIVIESENNIISNETSQLIDVNEENIIFSPKPEKEIMGEALLDPVTCEAHFLLQKEHVDIASSPSSDKCDKLEIESEIDHSSHEELINVDEIEKTVDNSEGTSFSMMDNDITDGDNNLVGEKTGRPVTELQSDGIMISIGTGPSSPDLLVKLEESEQSSPLLESEKITDDVAKDENTINTVQEIEISNDDCINSQENDSFEAEIPSTRNLKDFSNFETDKSLISEKLESSSETPITPCSEILEDNQTPDKAIINDVHQMNEKDVNSQENQELPMNDMIESSLKMENNDNKSIDEVTIDSIKKDAIRKIDQEENVDIEDETREFELSTKNSYERIIPELIITPKDEELESCNIEKGDGIDNDFGQKGEISKCEMEPFSETNEDISIMTAINKDEVEIGESQDFGLEELETCENELVSSDFIESCQPNEGLFDKELVDDLDLNIDQMNSISTTKTTQNNLVGEIASSEEKIVEQITSHDTLVDNLIEIDQTLSMGAESLLSVNEGVNLNISSIENLVLDENIQIDGLNDKEPCGSILGNDTIRNSDEVVSNNVKVDTDQEVIQNAENGANIGKGGMKQSILLSCNEPTSVVDGDTPIATVINLMSENLESDNRSDQQIPYPGSNINDNIIVSGSPEDESIFEIEHIGANESMVIEEDKNKIEAVEVQSIESNTLDIKTNTTREVKIEDNHEQEEEELRKVDCILEEKDVNFEIIDVNDDLIPVENELTSDKTADIIETKEEVKIEANYEQEKDEFKKENSIIEEKGVDLEIIDVNDDSIPVENEPTSDKTAAMIETNEEVKIEANYDQEKDEFKKEDSIIEEKGVDLEVIDINDDSIPVENELTSDKTAIIDSSSGVECIRNESPSTFQLSELSLGRQETFLLVSSSNTDTTDESTSKCGVKGLIERFSNNTTTSPSASIKIESIVQQDNVKCDPLSGKLEGREFYEVDDTETGHSNKLSQLIKHFESNTVDKAQRNVLTTDEIVKVVTSDNDVIEVRNEKEVIENKTSKDSEFDPTNIPTIVTDVISDEKDNEDETFSSQHEFDLCSIGSHDDDVVSKSYTDINDGSNDSLTRNGNFGSTEHLLLCVGGMAELEDSEIQPTTTNEEEINKSDLRVDDGKFNEINSQKESAVESAQDQSLIIVELTETINRESDRNDEIVSLETSGEVIKRYGTSNDLLADLMLEDNLIKNKAEDEEKSLVSFIQIDESMDLKEEETVKSELEEHPLIVEEAATEVENIDLQSQCVNLLDSENSGESFKQDSSSTLNDLLKVVVNSHLSQNEMASQETSMEVPSEIALPPLVETHSAELNETNENPVESSEPRDVCYEILNEISNEKSKTEEDSFLKTSISDKQGTDSTGSELNRSISLIVNSSLESDFCSNLQDEPISECVLETLLSKNENLESVEEPERDSIEDNVLPTEAGEAFVEVNQKQTTEELEWLDKQTNEIQEPASLSSFNLWPSNNDCKPSIESNTTVELSEDIDFDSIISAPSLDEALKKFEKRLSDKMSKETTSTIQQIIKSEVLEIEQTENNANHDRIMMGKQDKNSIEFGNSQNMIKIDSDINLKQENEKDVVYITKEENTSTDNEKLQSKTVQDSFNLRIEIDSLLINNEGIITPNAVTPDLKESVELESLENDTNSNQLLKDDESSNSFTERATVLEEAIVTENSESDSNKNNLSSELLNNKECSITQKVDISVDNITLINTVNSQKELCLNSEIDIMVDENKIMDNYQIDSYLNSEIDSFLRNEEHHNIIPNIETLDDIELKPSENSQKETHGNSEIDLLLGSGEYSVPQAIETINDNELDDTKNSQIETNLMCDTGSLLVNLEDIKDSIELNMETSDDSKIENDNSSQIEFDAECGINSPLENSDNNGSLMTPMLIDTLINEGSTNTTNHPSKSDSNIDNSDLLKGTIDENEIAVKIEAHGEDLKEHIDLVSSGDTLLIDQSSTSQNDAEICHTHSLLEPLPVNIDVEESIDHSFEFDENIQATQTPEPVTKYCAPCVDTTLYPPLSNHCSRPSSRMEVIREETEEISDNIQVEETKEEGLSPFLDSDDVSVSDISECLEKFDSLIQETELRDRDLLDIDENKLVEISVTDCDTGEHSDNLLLAESEIPECDRVIDELVDNSNSELGHQDLQGNEDHNSDIDSRDEKIVDVYEIHDIVHDKRPSFNLNADLYQNDSEKSVEKISSGDILVEEGKSTEVAEDDCKKSERKPRKSLVKSKKMFWDEKLKSLQAEQENRSKILIEKSTKTGSKNHSNRNIIQPALKINRAVNQQYDQGEVPDTKISSTSKMNKSVNQQCNKHKMSDTKNEIINKDFGKQSHSNTQSKPNLIVEEPVKIVVELSDENNEIVDDRKSVYNWKNYWNNLLVNEKDEETQAISRQPSIRVKGIVASSRSLFENSNTNLERSISCEILSNKSVMSDKKRAPARSVGENLNKIGLETPVKSSHIRGENSETLQKSESVSNILERIKFFERSSNETRGGNNIEMTMNFINRKKCSLENTSTPCSPTTIKIDYFDDNQDESLPCQILNNKKMKSESMDSSDGDLYNPLTMTLSGRVRSFSTGKIDETPDGSLSNIEEDRSAKGSDQCLEKSDEELKNTNTGMLEITTQLSRAKSEGNLSMSEKVTSRARFEQAKSFFKCLEEENLVSKKMSGDDCLIPQKPRRLKQISMDSDSCGEGCKPKKKESKYRRRGRRRRKDSSAMKVRSAPTSDSECRMSMYDREFGGSERHKRISERFHVKHLFRDIAGDTDGIFKGIPNRKAVLASLEDLRADSVPDDQQDYEEPSRSHSLSSIPSGYQDEYPYLPTTPPSQYKHRSQLEDRLISRCKLVTYEMEI